MSYLQTKPKHKISFKHQTHKSIFVRFSLILAIFIGYFLFISSKYGYGDGLFITWLMWSFFVLCTPVADAGMLIDFPIRLVTDIRMIFSEIMVWLIAIILNMYVFFFRPELYSHTQLLQLFKHILENPFPFWAIILISGIGTFLSIQLGDNLLDIIKHKNNKKVGMHELKIKIIYMVFILGIAFVLYDFLLTKFGFDIPL